MQASPERKLLSVREAAESLGLKESTVRQWVWLRQIEFVRLGRCVRIRSEVVDRLIAEGTVPPLKMGE